MNGKNLGENTGHTVTLHGLDLISIIHALYTNDDMYEGKLNWSKDGYIAYLRPQHVTDRGRHHAHTLYFMLHVF